MKKRYAFALCALAAPVLTIGAGSVLAQQSTHEDTASKQEAMQPAQDSERAEALVTADSRAETRSFGADRSSSKDQGTSPKASRNQSHGYMATTPANSMKISDLMGADVKTTRDEDVGNVSDILIDADGQIVAVVVGVGGVLGMGEKDVAIGWDEVTRSSDESGISWDSDDSALRINATHKDLESAPKYVSQK